MTTIIEVFKRSLKHLCSFTSLQTTVHILFVHLLTISFTFSVYWLVRLLCRNYQSLLFVCLLPDSLPETALDIDDGRSLLCVFFSFRFLSIFFLYFLRFSTSPKLCTQRVLFCLVADSLFLHSRLRLSFVVLTVRLLSVTECEWMQMSEPWKCLVGGYGCIIFLCFHI